ncbi:MAG: Mov34/MPN/PAD-1 family protein [Thermoplasmatales archaeon]|nr:Mov34/MPN/PAD-1 family protein [Thermoplasmatales archaeon]
MGIFDKKQGNSVQPEWKITEKCLELILESSKSTYPNEFGGLLRVDDDIKDTITEVVLLPGTISGDSHAIFKLHMMPIDFSIVGTVHSHPSPYATPSDADLLLFRKHGKVHIIAANPFNKDSWKAYDYNGEEIDLKVV